MECVHGPPFRKPPGCLGPGRTRGGAGPPSTALPGSTLLAPYLAAKSLHPRVHPPGEISPGINRQAVVSLQRQATIREASPASPAIPKQVLYAIAPCPQAIQSSRYTSCNSLQPTDTGAPNSSPARGPYAQALAPFPASSTAHSPFAQGPTRHDLSPETPQPRLEAVSRMQVVIHAIPKPALSQRLRLRTLAALQVLLQRGHVATGKQSAALWVVRVAIHLLRHQLSKPTALRRVCLTAPAGSWSPSTSSTATVARGAHSAPARVCLTAPAGSWSPRPAPRAAGRLPR